MICRISKKIAPNTYLLTLGETCLILLECNNEYVLFDCGASWHSINLGNRLASLGLELEKLKHLVLTCPSPARIAGLPYLLEEFPNLQIYAEKLVNDCFSADKWLENLQIFNAKINNSYQAYQTKTISIETYKNVFNNIAILNSKQCACFGIEPVTIPSLSRSSLAGNLYYLLKDKIVLADFSFGIFNKANLPVPGTILDLGVIEEFRSLLEKKYTPEYLVLPLSGAISGEQINKYIINLKECIKALDNDKNNATKAGLEQETARKLINESYFSTQSDDPIMQIVADWILGTPTLVG